MLLRNPNGDIPQIDKTAYVCKSAMIIGNVIIGENVFVSSHTSIRADEPGSAIIIGNNCNIQDNVIVHALANTKVIIDDFTSLSHGCIVHGPVNIGMNCFIGFNSVVFDCSIGNMCFISHRALVKNVSISDRRIVEDGGVINEQADANKLGEITGEILEFNNNVIQTNIKLARNYSKKHLIDVHRDFDALQKINS
ncbi:MAG: carbonate dehydratase [Candidatus Methanoperedens sp.]|nr:carbonate dehydratase [Candidatus Methanoperedens sp.]